MSPTAGPNMSLGGNNITSLNANLPVGVPPPPPGNPLYNDGADFNSIFGGDNGRNNALLSAAFGGGHQNAAMSQFAANPYAKINATNASLFGHNVGGHHHMGTVQHQHNFAQGTANQQRHKQP